MAEELEHILDECIERVLQGEGLEQCLQRYPQHAEQLEPLLQVVLAARDAASIEPRPEYRLQARQQLRSVLYGQKSKGQHVRTGLLHNVKSGLNGLIAGFRDRPILQKALAVVLVVALVTGLSLTIPSLFDQSSVALAEEIAINDPGVQAQLEETGFDATRLRTTAVRSEKEDNTYFVYFVNPEDGSSIGTVTVDIKSKTVTDKSFVQSVKELAAEIAAEDPGVLAQLAETGLDAATVRTTTVRSEKEDNTYYVYFVNAEDGSSIGTVTVDVKSKTVTDKSFTQSVKEMAAVIAAEDTAVRAQLSATGLDATRLRTTAVRSEKEDNTYFVYFVNPEDGSSIGTVTVDVKSKTVTGIRLTSDSAQVLVP